MTKKNKKKNKQPVHPPPLNPYKGLLPYREQDNELFRGRETEKNKLLKLVEYNPLTVVFGRSGIGKTSLLHAGLFPELRKKDFLPVVLRLDYSPSAPGLTDQVQKKTRQALKKNNIQEKEKNNEAEEPGPGETLWEYFHRVKHFHPTGSKMITPVLVFDQFEEIFTLGKNNTAVPALIEELYCLMENQVPGAVKTRIKKEKKRFPYMKEETRVRVIVSLREDYLPHLNSFTSLYPALDRVMFRVLHLHGKQAGEAIKVPGGIRDEKIITDILDLFQPEDDTKVPPEKLEIEPSLLSLLCFQLFEKQDAGAITKSYQDKILANFYDSVLKKFPAEVNRFVETKLLTEGGFRTPFYLHKNHKLRSSIAKLVNRRILRKVYYGEKEHIEIIHDVLAPIIKEKRDRRVKKTKNAIIAVLTGLLIIMSALAWYALHQKNRVQKQLVNSLTSKASLVLKTDNVKAIRIAGAAYDMEAFSPPPRALLQVLTDAAASTYERPFYSVKIQQTDDINDARFSPDETKIVTASPDGTARLWDSDGNLAADSFQHDGVINSVGFSPDGRQILTASDDTTVKLWSLEGKCINEYKHSSGVNYAEFSPDGTKILTLAWDNIVRLWDPESEENCKFEYKHTRSVLSAKFSPDGRRIFTTSTDGIARVWDLEGKSPIDYIHAPSAGFTSFSPDGSKIFTTASDSTVHLWDLQGNESARLIGHSASVFGAVFSHDGSRIVTWSQDKTAKVWDSDGVHLYDLVHDEAVSNAVFSRDGSRVLTCSEDKTARVWNLNREGKLFAEFQKHKGGVKSAEFSPDGEKIVTASDDGAVKLFDLNGKLLTDLIKHNAPVYSAKFSPDGNNIVTASKDKTAGLWDLNGVLRNNFPHEGAVNSAVFSPDGKKIVTASDDKTARLWDSNGGLQNNFPHEGEVNSAVFSPDGKRILTASYDGTVKRLDLKGKIIKDYKYSSPVNYAEFSPDGKRILTTSDDGIARVSDLNGSILVEFNKHIGIVRYAVFSPDGRRILTAFPMEGAVRLCDLNGSVLVEYNKHIGTISSAVFSPDGRRILTANDEGFVRLWYTPEAIIEWLKTAEIHRLTEAEKKECGIE